MPDRQDNQETYDLFITPSHEEKKEAEDLKVEQELANEEVFKTQAGDGHTLDPHLAQDQGLTYTPPTDPPVIPGGDRQGAEVAGGFGLSQEESPSQRERLPDRVSHSDLELRDTVYAALRTNSETGHLTHVKVQVDEGAVNLIGTVVSEADIGLVQEIVAGLDGVRAIKNNLQTEEI